MNGTAVVAIICIAIGIVCFAVGYLFRVMHWPGAFLSIYAGQGLLLIGIVISIFGKIKRS